MNKVAFNDIGIGIDIENCDYFRRTRENYDKFNKIFTDFEKEYCLNMEEPYIHFCGRFAAKEAAIKALSSLGISNIPLNIIEIRNTQQGVPQMQINDSKYQNLSIKMSISHTKEQAVAIVIMLRVEK
jgi:phosphopantetheine--protein transferase-like protein